MSIPLINCVQIPLNRMHKVLDMKFEGVNVIISTKEFSIKLYAHQEEGMLNKYRENLYLERIGDFEAGGEKIVIIRLKNPRRRFCFTQSLKLNHG